MNIEKDLDDLQERAMDMCVSAGMSIQQVAAIGMMIMAVECRRAPDKDEISMVNKLMDALGDTK